MNNLERFIPAVSWLRQYKRADLPADLMAGLIVTVMLVPQGMAYALLAGLPPVIGLYASTIPLIIYSLFGSSRQLAVGPVAIVSLLTFSGVSLLAESGTSEFIAYAALLALMVGLLQFILGLVRAGFITNFLSHAVISGFTSAAAIVIGLSQLKHLLGINLEKTHTVFELLWQATKHFGETNFITLAIGILSITSLLVFKRFMPRFPAPLLVVVLSSILVYFFSLQSANVDIVGQVPKGLPSFSLPLINFGFILALLPTALTIAFVGFMESIAIAKSIAAKEKYKLDANQELIGLGLANIVGSLFRAYPVTGGFARSAVNYQAGAKTPLASLITALLIVLTLLFFTPLFYYLPKAVLAAIVMVAVFGLIDVQGAVHLFELKPIDGWTLVITFVATLVIGIEQGILIGVGFSLLVFIWRSAYPHTAELGYLAKEDVFRNIHRYPEAKTFAGTIILRIDASLYFANMAFLKTLLNNVLLSHNDLHTIILDFSGVNAMDAVALETLEELMNEFHNQGTNIHIASMKGPVRDLAAKAGWSEKFSSKITHLSIRGALEALEILPAAKV